MKLRPLRSIFSATNHHKSPSPPPPKLEPLSNLTTTISHTTTSLYNNPVTVSVTVSRFQLNSSLKFHAVHNHLLYASTGNQIHVIHTSSFTLLDTFTVNKSSSGSVKSIAFSNGYIYTSHQDNKIRVWRLTKNKRHKHIATLPTLEDRLLRSVLPKNYVNVRRHRKKLWVEHHDVVSGLAVISAELMCSVSWDKYLKIWRTSDFRCVESIKAHDDAINAVVVAVDGTIFTGSADRRINVWRKMKSKYGLITTLEKHKSAVNALALNNEGSMLFSGGGDQVILVWKKEHGSVELREVLRGHSKAVLCLINVCDLLFSGSADRTVRIWQHGVEGKFYCLKVVDGYERPVRSLVGEAGSEDDCKCSIRVFSECNNGVIRLITVKGLFISDSMLLHV